MSRPEPEADAPIARLVPTPSVVTTYINAAPGMAVIRSDLAESLREKERKRDPEYRRQQREQAEAERRARLATSAAPVTIGRLRGHRNEWMLREAAVELVKRYCGGIRVVDGGVRIVAPPFVARGKQDFIGQHLTEVVEVLCEATDAILAATKGKSGTVDPSTLPDRQVLPGGSLL
jgi:hypothetical protein